MIPFRIITIEKCDTQQNDNNHKDADCSIFLIVMLSFVMLNVVILIVVAQYKELWLSEATATLGTWSVQPFTVVIYFVLK